MRKRLYCSVGALLIAAMAATLPAAAQSTPPVPILFNDRHVDANPDRLISGRVLAALVRNGVVLVPLRSMLEQTGATVSWDPTTRTADVSKPGADVKVTVGKPVVVVNGEERPLDVPPEIYRGAVVVPVRVISEAMGAYVQWVAAKHEVVIRYVSAPVPAPLTTPAPTPLPAAPPAASPVPAPPLPTPSPTATPYRYEHFIAADLMVSPKIYNELSPGNSGTSSFIVHGALEFPVAGLSGMLEGSVRRYQYAHAALQNVAGCAPGDPNCATVVGNAVYRNGICPAPDPGCVTVVGFQALQAFNGLGQAYVPALTAQETDAEIHAGVKVFDPRVYVGAAYMQRMYNYLGYPNISGAGVGISKLPDLDTPFSLYASAWYYPSVSGRYTYPTSPFLGTLSGSTTTLSFSYWKYTLGGTLNLGNSGLFVDLGYDGQRATAKTNAPSNTSLGTTYAGLGFRF